MSSVKAKISNSCLPVVGKALSYLLAFLLVFSCGAGMSLLGGNVQTAFAASASSNTNTNSSGNANTNSNTNKGGSTTPQWDLLGTIIRPVYAGGTLYDANDNVVRNDELYQQELCASYDDTTYTYTLKGTATVSLRGTVLFEGASGDLEESATNFKGAWSSSNEAVAIIDDSGVITPKSEGTTTIKLTCTVDGEQVATSFKLVVADQSTARTITSVSLYQITSEGDEPVLARVEVNEKSDIAAAQFYAIVTVTDPVTGETTEYNTKNGRLSTQASDLTDLSWSVDDETIAGLTDYGIVDARCLTYGMCYVYCTWGAEAGQNHHFILGFYDPDEEVDPGYTATDTLTIKPYYYLSTDTDRTSPQYLDEITITLDELENEYDHYYARFTQVKNNYKWATILAYGVSLKDVLTRSGINIDDIIFMKLGSDVGDTSGAYGTGDFFFQTRYYFPNLDEEAALRYSGTTVSEPMIALRSYKQRQNDPDPHLAMDNQDYEDQGLLTDSTRFFFLFGATKDASGKPQTNAKYQVYNLNVIELELNPPSVDPVVPGDDPDNPGGGGTDPSDDPSGDPSDDPSGDPSGDPSDDPSGKPSDDPTDKPDKPSDDPSDKPDKPSDDPSDKPDKPSDNPSDKPSDDPSDKPSEKPAHKPDGTHDPENQGNGDGDDNNNGGAAGGKTHDDTNGKSDNGDSGNSKSDTTNESDMGRNSATEANVFESNASATTETADTSETTDTSDASESAASESSYGTEGDSASAGATESYKIYQVMNPDDSSIDKTLDYSNPYKAAAPWIALLVALLSGGGYCVWFRRQTRDTGKFALWIAKGKEA